MFEIVYGIGTCPGDHVVKRLEIELGAEREPAGDFVCKVKVRVAVASPTITERPCMGSDEKVRMTAVALGSTRFEVRRTTLQWPYGCFFRLDNVFR